MATCKDCIHYDACVSILRKTFPKVTGEIDKPNCHHFAEGVVRCENCRYFYKGKLANRCTLFSLGLKMPHRDAYCCYGERKE